MIAIINYGAGNTRSVMNALDRVGASYVLTSESEKILAADHVIFPGVGHAKPAMIELQHYNLIEVIKNVKNPLLGICVGMQLLFDWSEEGNTACLGIIGGNVSKFESLDQIVPQTGWNHHSLTSNQLFEGMGESEMFYSVHSYKAEPNASTISTAIYGSAYCSAVQKDNFYGVQFHPEKSSKIGKKLLENFIKL